MLMHLVHEYRGEARRREHSFEEAQRRYMAAEAKYLASEEKYQASEAEQRVLQEKIGASNEKIRALTAELDEEKGAHSLARSELRAAEARLVKAEEALAARGQELEGAHGRHLELERELRDLERKASYHEARELEARENAQNAVKFFRESEEFCELMAEEGVNGLIQGFRNFRNQLRRLLPDFDVNLLQPGAGRTEAEAETPVAEAAVADPEVTEVAPEATPVVAEAIVEVSAAEPTTPGTAEAEVAEVESLV
ncbi:uncharacterized protein LOC120111390 [Phoenix dactylifera]|uniref:Uncharacterized protein LOC120111390 n=1 Tax=Phoenix dactylifera TaxID=42345 RepID=A0A8B9AK19_PHODC|nr:uncharacterized protein LOC120111390 [Phoenix dactylifera]